MASTTTHRPQQSIQRPQQRHRSSSDPFLDPVYPAPYLTYTDTHYSRSAPPVPPPPPKPRKNTYHQNDARDPAMLEAAVRDAVTVAPQETSPRGKMGRSQTGGVQTATSTSSRPAAVTSRRSHSQDSVIQVANAVEKARRAGKPKKGSSHADVIDRLDFTGVGPMFHHDGPFDACAPSRNRHKTRAPMLAWSSPGDEEPVSAAQHRADRRLRSADPYAAAAAYNNSPYPTSALNPADIFSQTNKQVDRIAEAWGMHEPEPYEEFFGGAPTGQGDTSETSSLHGGDARDPNRNRARELREGFKDYYDERDASRPQQKRHATRTKLPPPQPIFLPGAGPAAAADGPSSPRTGVPSSPGLPRRNKSIMQKFRKKSYAADGTEIEEDSASPSSSLEGHNASTSPTESRPGRPAHRHQNSFFGRFGRNTSAHAPVSPIQPEISEQYVYVDKSSKALPPRPPGESPADEKNGYFDNPPLSPGGTPASPNSGLDRKTSLLKKVKGVVLSGNK